MRRYLVRGPDCRVGEIAAENPEHAITIAHPGSAIEYDGDGWYRVYGGGRAYALRTAELAR